MNTLLIRWMIHTDLPEVVKIEKSSRATNHWVKEDFIHFMKQKSVIGMVIEIVDSKKIVGFMIYELMSSRINLLNLCIHPEFRGQDLGTSLILKLYSKLSIQGRQKVVAEVRETNLDGQLFFKRMGFVATEVLRAYFEDSGEDAFVMEYKLDGSIPLIPHAPSKEK